MDYISFYEKLHSIKLITPIRKYILDIIKDIIKENKKYDIYLKIFAIYFSLIDSGNATMALDEKKLFEKKDDNLLGKWGILLNDAKILGEEDEEFDINSFNEIVCESLEIIKQNNLDEILSLDIIVGKNKIFEIENIKGVNYIYLKIYNHARLGVIDSMNRLFINTKGSFSNNEKISIEDIYAKGNNFKLNNEQEEIIKKGLNNNILVTGGPGTGKTTSILFLLFYLISNAIDKNIDFNIYLTAASGKAASRMKDSLIGGISNINSDFPNYEKIKNVIDTRAKEYTIHRLLSIDFNTGLFNYNKRNQFEKNSIFIIDEASMIDICLFNSLLEAIPTGARVFILGDKNQLPSVDVGAVFSDLLDTNIDKVELIKSNRFKEETKVFKYAKSINDGESVSFEPSIMDASSFNVMNDLDDSMVEKEDKISNCPVYVYNNDSTNKQKEQKELIESMLNKWVKQFYYSVANNVSIQKMCSDINPNPTIEQLDSIFYNTERAKILCAENESVRGVKAINNYIKKKAITPDFKGLSNHYAGEVMMINTNNKLLGLYNGDTGILVTFDNDDTLYFMVQKNSTTGETEKTVNDKIFSLYDKYMFYPFRLISLTEINLAYAITIHKSQGSDYKNILIVLPTAKGHPLLNRQILYTAITRTKGYTYILSNEERINEAIDRRIVRDTNIIL